MSSLRNLTVGLFVLLTLAAPSARQEAPDNTGSAEFVVLLSGARVGTETVSLSRTLAGWTIFSTSHLAPPFDLTTTKFEMRYGLDWQPQGLSIEGTLRGQPLALTTTFGLTTASNDIVQDQQHKSNSQQTSPRTVVLPNYFYGAYEALAARLAPLSVGARLPVYIVPDTEITATIDLITPRRISFPDHTIDVRQFDLTVANPAGPLPVEVWVDSRNRLARVVVPTSSLVVVRDDLSSVMAREERIHNAGDESAFVPANGFNLAATVTTPPNAPQKAPAVVLVSTSGPQDRDCTTYGISICGQLAGSIAAGGYVVVRYDGRGIGQSGGRTETAAISEYADDALRVVAWLKDRKGVDADRIAIVGYGTAGPIALEAASHDGNVKAVALVAAPGVSGKDLTLEQQQHVLSRLKVPDSEKAARVALERRIIDASLTNGNWDGVPLDARRAADQPWFKSWLLFDPAKVINKLHQPLLILGGSLDTEMPPSYADRLEALSRARQKTAAQSGPTALTVRTDLLGVNHLLIPARTGESDEYGTLESRMVDHRVGDAIVLWLKQVLVKR